MAISPTSSDATTIINAVAAEVGLIPVVDPYSSVDPNFLQLRTLLNVAGDEMTYLFDWDFLVKTHTIVTAAVDDGDYDLPDDYAHITNSTAWDTTSQLPLSGPLTPQNWSALESRLVNSLITFGYRIRNRQIDLYPNNPVGRAATLTFEYVRNDWVVESDLTTRKTIAETGTDIVLYHRILAQRYLKLKWLLAKQMDATSAQDDFNQMFSLITGADKGARVLDAGSGGLDIHYVDTQHNVSDTGYGV